MARLCSEDEQIKSSIELLLLKEKKQIKNQDIWVPYNLIIESGNKKVIYKKEDDNYNNGDFVFSLVPSNEIEKLVNEISNFLIQEEGSSYSFEPLEPSFELEVEKSHKGYSVYIWVDAGNVASEHYTWDGLGIRFFTTEEKIHCFIEELKREVKEYNYA